MEPIAALPMYDPPGLMAANDALWAWIATRLQGAPRALSRGGDLMTLWRHPGLLLAQTCGYPLMTRLSDHARVLATPVYDAPGCDGAWHRAAILVRAKDPARALGDLFGARLAINDPLSNTGMNLPRARIAPLARGARFFGSVVVTGAHALSAAAVAGGEADVCAVDAVTWAHLERLEPALAGRLRILDWTDASPGLPLVTARATSAATRAALMEVLTAAMAAPDLAWARRALRLEGIVTLPKGAYDRILELEREAADHGYPVLA